jgi:hypothetical protein
MLRGTSSVFDAQGVWTSYSRGQFMKTALLRANTLCIHKQYTATNKMSVSHACFANKCTGSMSKWWHIGHKQPNAVILAVHKTLQKRL